MHTHSSVFFGKINYVIKIYLFTVSYRKINYVIKIYLFIEKYIYPVGLLLLNYLQIKSVRTQEKSLLPAHRTTRLVVHLHYRTVPLKFKNNGDIEYRLYFVCMSVTISLSYSPHGTPLCSETIFLALSLREIVNVF